VPAYRKERIVNKLSLTQAKSAPPSTITFTKFIGEFKGWPSTVGRAVLVALSLASAHYFGFMSRTPFEIASIVTIDFLPTFISTFSFYFLLCYTVSRVFAFIASQMLFATGHTLAALSLRLRRHWPHHFARTATKVYKESIIYENPAYLSALFIGTLFLFNISYLELSHTNFGEAALTYTLITIIAISFKLGFLARSPAKVIKRLRDEKRVANRRKIKKTAIYFGSAIALAFSYYAGLLRFDKLTNEHPVMINSGHFTGAANVLLRSGNSQLVLRHTEEQREYIYFNQHISIRIEIKRNAKTETQSEG